MPAPNLSLIKLHLIDDSKVPQAVAQEEMKAFLDYIQAKGFEKHHAYIALSEYYDFWLGGDHPTEPWQKTSLLSLVLTLESALHGFEDDERILKLVKERLGKVRALDSFGLRERSFKEAQVEILEWVSTLLGG